MSTADNQKEQEEEDEEETLFFDPDLFVDKDYKEMVYDIDDFQQPVFALNAASTDYDLTGQIVWPVSVFLSWFVARNRELFEGQHVMELGAGCGLPGLVAARFAAKATLTDGNEVVLDLLTETKDKLQLDNIALKQLLWGNREQLESLLVEGGVPDVIIGADVICWPNFIAPLLWTLKEMLSRKPTARCFVGYVCRAIATTTILHEQAAKFGLSIKELDSSFLPEPEPENVKSALKLELLEIVIADQNRIGPAEDDCSTAQSPEGGSADQQGWWAANTPC